MKGYWLILSTVIIDTEAQAKYVELWGPIAAKYGARLLGEGAALDLRESRPSERVVLVEFPDIGAARACYDDPAYRLARDYALAAAHRDLVILEGKIGQT